MVRLETTGAEQVATNAGVGGHGDGGRAEACGRHRDRVGAEQTAGTWDVWATSLHNPDFSKYAENCGALGIRVTDAGALDDALRKGLEHDGPALIEIMADPLLV